MITIRKFDFDMQQADACSYARTKTLTRILNSFSLLLPVGERFFIESIRAYRSQVSPEMQEQINLFIRQEGQHGKEHIKLNAMLLPEEEIAKVNKETLELLNSFGKTKDEALLTTITLERITGLMGIILPRFKKIIFKDRSEIAHMWVLHGKEELEHVPVGEKLFKQECNYSKIDEAVYMWKAVSNLTRMVVKNYKLLKKYEA